MNLQGVALGCSLWFTLLAATAAAQHDPRFEREPLFPGMSPHKRVVTTDSVEAQRFFDQGLNFLYAFNHEEAIRSFLQAARLDPDCAMAWWGIAVAHGPHINNPKVDDAHARAAWDALLHARSSVADKPRVEQALVAALAERYAERQPEDRRPLDEAYARAMREVWEGHNNDADIGALFAESLMDLRPWDLWTSSGSPQPGTEEVLETLERVLELDPDHPLGLHLYIHAVEASPHPERARAAADRLRYLAPGIGHLTHMPSHIDVRTGRWREAELANERAIIADRAYRAVRPHTGFFRIYMLHNEHMLAFAAMMRGNSARAIRALDESVASVPPDWLQDDSLAALADGYLAMPIEGRVRFGRWDEVLRAPDFEPRFPVARAVRHMARGVALAALGRLDEARAEQEAFLETRKHVSEEAPWGNNLARDVLDVAEHMLAGEILYHAGAHAEALRELETAVLREDRLRYDEPPDWVLPVRHALGAALLKAGKFDEAEAVYRADLERLPENGWSLFGLARTLEAQGNMSEATLVQKRFEEVWRDADLVLRSSCYCLADPG